ncbi:hypothetical protein HA461_13775 [Rhizobium leguminosarum bv. trifolii]|uniref:hypothetical protein n=1 Tax=Rhizobium leguminosarum TaxID=384 RepID=UPI00140FED30|nr:hypothetical protein [Rhizobium leguminosarum]QIO52175.1 hypothetical protein HA461_13775 [Rhizobium leguminosarum bv. trifolii]
MMRETNCIHLEELPDLPSRLARVAAIAAEIEGMPDETYAPVGSILDPIEWFSLAAVAKSTSNAHAFQHMVVSRNSIAAAAIVRMQIEAAMRLFGLTLVENPDDAGARLMKGERYSSLRMKGDGPRLVDKLLHEELSKLYAWVTDAYESTSAYVHLDRVAINSKLTYLEPDAFFSLSGIDKAKPEEAYYHLVDTFFIALRMTKQLLEDFLATRPKPCERAERLAKFRRERYGNDEI